MQQVRTREDVRIQLHAVGARLGFHHGEGTAQELALSQRCGERSIGHQHAAGCVIKGGLLGGYRVGYTVGAASAQVGAQNQRVGDEGTHGVAGEGNHGDAVPLEVQDVHALGTAGLLAHVAEP